MQTKNLNGRSHLTKQTTTCSFEERTSLFVYEQWSEQLSTLEQVEHALPRYHGKKGFALLQSQKPGVTGY